MSSTLPYQVDLTNCDREPIHQLGAIQPIGFMLVLSSDWMISRVSANIGEFFDVVAADLIGSPIVDLFAVDAVHSLRNRLALLRGPDALERIFGCALFGGEKRFDVALHMSEGSVVVEAEPTSEHAHGDATGTVRGMIARLDQAPDLTAFFNEGSRQVRALTGFDRVMIYRFDPDGSGHVVAESARSGIGSFLGLHYPPSDIPRQARELYKRSLLRVITDVDAIPVPIMPALDGKGRIIGLDGIREAGLWKGERVVEGPQGARVAVGGREVLNFCANNYLGLANEPALIRAVQDGLARWGFGLASVRFICGRNTDARTMGPATSSGKYETNIAYRHMLRQAGISRR